MWDPHPDTCHQQTVIGSNPPPVHQNNPTSCKALLSVYNQDANDANLGLAQVVAQNS